MADLVKLIFAKPIHLAIQVVKIAHEASDFFYEESVELESRTVKLLDVLRQAAKASSDLYEPPTRAIIDHTNQVLEKAHALILKCRSDAPLLMRVFTIIPASSFRKMSEQLENSLGDVSWLLRISQPAKYDSDYLGLPPFAADRPILCLIWEMSATVYSGSHAERSDAAASLVSLARDNDRYGKQIIEEGGIGPLLKLVKDGNPEGQENAARAIGLLASVPDQVEHFIHDGICSVFADALKEGPMNVQATVAWAISELAGNYPKCQHRFAQHNIISLLVGHLAFETDGKRTTSTDAGKRVVDEDDKSSAKYPLCNHQNLNDTVASSLSIETAPEGNVSKDTTAKTIKREMSARALWRLAVDKSAIFRGANHLLNINCHDQSNSLIGTSTGYEESEDTTGVTRAMAARALWHLAIDNAAICRSITESKAMLCFSVLLERGTEDERYNSAMALMEITAMGEKDADLGRSAFKPNSPTRQAVVDQLLEIINMGDSKLLIPCVKSIGNLSRTCRVTETRMISPLVRLLDESGEDIPKVVSIVLTKAVCHENYLCIVHSKAMLSAGAVRHLVQLVYFGEQLVQIPALILLSYIILHVPDSEELAKNEVMCVIEWAEKQLVFVHDNTLRKLLPEAKSELELYQGMSSRVQQNSSA